MKITDPNRVGLIITIGCPGAGKSTWAERNLSKHTLRLERDRFRECLFGSRRAYHESPIEPDDRSRVITAAMRAAMAEWPHDSWAVTDTGLRYESVEPFLWDRAGAGVTLVIFNRSWDYINHINETRQVEHRIPDGILREMFDMFMDPDAWWRGRTDFDKILITG